MLLSFGQTKSRSIPPVRDAGRRSERRPSYPVRVCLSLLAISFGFASQSIGFAGSTPAAGSIKIDFDRDIRPIFSDTCYACHGPDKANRKAGLRLDQRESAFGPHDNGPAIVAGDLSHSALYRRITSQDKEERMPPPDSGAN